MFSWVWILWLRTLWTVDTCSFRIRCSVEDGNLQKPNGRFQRRPLSANVIVGTVKPLHPGLVQIRVQNVLWGDVHHQGCGVLGASRLISEEDSG